MPAAGLAMSPFDLALYAFSVAIWGTSWIALRMQLGVVAPEVSLVWRFVIAAACMWVWALWRGSPFRYGQGDHVRFMGLGLFLFSLNFTLFYYGGITVPSGLLSVVFSLAAVLNPLLAALLFRQRIGGRVLVGGMLGVAGVALMFWPQYASELAAGRSAGILTGLALCVAGTLSFCSGNMVSAASQARGASVLDATAWGMSYGVVFLTLVCLVRGHTFTIDTSPAYLLSLFWLAIPASVAAFMAYLTLLGRIGSARAGYATVLFPVVALLISTLFEDYRWTLPAFAGLAFVIAGNLAVLRR